MTFPPEVWDGVLCRLAADMPSFAVDSWLAPLVAEPDGARLRLLSPNPFHRNRVRERLAPRVGELLREALGRPVEVRVEVGGSDEQRARARARVETLIQRERPEGAAAQAVPAPQAGEPSQERERAGARGAASGPQAAPRGSRRLAQQQSFDQCFDNFVVGPANALAREVALAIAEGRHHELRQLYLHCASGLGKTHLARAVCGAVPDAGRIRYTTAEAFTNEFMTAVRSRQMHAFKRRYRRGCELLVVDDVHFLQGKVGTQLELFHTIEHLADAGARVVLTGDRPLQELDLLEPQLRARLAGGFVASIEPPDARLRRAILRQKASAAGVRLPEAGLDLLVEHVRGSVRDLEGALVQLVATASLLKRPIDLPLVRETLAAKGVLASADARRATPERVIAAVARFFDTTPAALCARSRRRDVLVPRQLAMYLCRRFTDASLADIGRALGRDHPAVRNAIRRVERDVLARAPARYQLEAVSERVREELGL